MTDPVEQTLPHDVEIEKIVLGAAISSPDLMVTIGEFLDKNSFYDTSHKQIFSLLSDMDKNDIPIDIVSVVETAKKKEILAQIGGGHYLSVLSNNYAPLENIAHYCLILKEKYMRRQLIRSSHKAISMASDESIDVFEAVDQTEKQVSAITDFDINIKNSYQTGVIEDTKKGLSEKRKLHGQGKIIGVPSGFEALDKITLGLLPAEVIIVSARPGVGKTAFACSIMKECGVPIGMFSQEMKEEKVLERILSNDLEILFEDIKAGGYTEQQERLMGEKLNEYKDRIIILNEPEMDVWKFRKQAKRWIKDHGVKMIIGDYLQLFSSDKRHGSREQEVSYVARHIKATARKLDVPIILLSQLSRETEKSGDKIPKLHHLRDSGDIEQVADMVIFIHRPAYYLSTQELIDKNISSDYAQLIIAKHRNGERAVINMSFDGQYQRFSDPNKYSYQTKDADDWIESNKEDKF